MKNIVTITRDLSTTLSAEETFFEDFLKHSLYLKSGTSKIYIFFTTMNSDVYSILVN